MPRVRRTKPAAGVSKYDSTKIPEPERIARTRMMRSLVVMTNSRDEIVHAMQDMFPGISSQAVDRLRTQVEQAVIAESKEAVLTRRSKQINRLMGHIAQARAQKKWSAVASLERLFADISGTMQPIKIIDVGDNRVKDALGAILTKLTPEQAKALSEGQEIPIGHIGPETADFETTGEEFYDE
jgi:hypothetical protein